MEGALKYPQYNGSTATQNKLTTFKDSKSRLEVVTQAERFDVGYSLASELKPPLQGSAIYNQDGFSRAHRGRRYEVSISARYAGYGWVVDVLRSGNDSFVETGLMTDHLLYVSGSSGSRGFLRRYDLKVHAERCPHCRVEIKERSN